MNAVDWILVLAATAAALLGWRAGLIRSLLGVVGFVLGAAGALYLVPKLVDQWTLPSGARALVVLSLVLIAAFGMQALFAWLASAVRNRITWKPAQWLDALGGAGFGVLGFVVVVWMVANAFLLLPHNPATPAVESSRVLDSLDARFPDSAKQALYDAESQLQGAAMPVIAGGLFTPADSTPAPPAEQAVTEGVAASIQSVVRVWGDKPACGIGSTGSGYVSTPQHVTTNAHVVAGMPKPRITTSDGRTYRGEVVAFDPNIDVAVVYAPDLPLDPVPTSTEAGVGTTGAVAGYPGGGDLSVAGAVVRAEVRGSPVVGENIYGQRGVSRDVYVLTTHVVPGNSGGPLLGTDGSVLGLVFAQALEDPDVGYALTAAQFRPVSRAAGSSVQPVDTGACVQSH